MTGARRIFGPPQTDLRDKRFLLVSPEFPPHTSAGSLRWQEMSRVFSSHGWQMDVLTAEPTDSARTDWTRLARLPPATRVFAVATKKSFAEQISVSLSRAFSALRGARSASPVTESRSEDGLSSTASLEPGPSTGLRGSARVWVEDASERGFVQAFAKVGVHQIRERDYAFVVSCGPPHWAHEAALRIAEAGRLKLVIDLRDPWAILEPKTAHQVHPDWVGLATSRESAVYERASLVLMNTEPAANVMRAAHQMLGRDEDKVIAIRNGFDHDSVVFANDSRRAVPECFRIVYAGTVYLDRDPTGLFGATAEFVRSEGVSPDQFGLLFVGPSDVDVLRAGAKEHGLAAYVKVHPPCARTQLLQILADASVLVSLPQGHDLAIPSKIYEYMHFEAWLLALATPDSATAQLLSGSEAIVVDPAEGEELVRTLKQLYGYHRAGRRAPRLDSNADFGREAQARLLIDRLEEDGLLGPA